MGNHHIPLKLSVLRAIDDLGREAAYGIAIGKKLLEYGRPEPSVGALYTTLVRLVEEDLASTHKGPKIEERGGKCRTYYSLTENGRAVLNQYVQDVSHLINNPGNTNRGFATDI